MEMTENAAQSKSDNQADAAKPTSICRYGQLSEQQSMHLLSSCLTPIPETSGFAYICEGKSEYEQLISVGCVQPAAISSEAPRVIGNRILPKDTVFARLLKVGLT